MNAKSKSKINCFLVIFLFTNYNFFYVYSEKATDKMWGKAKNFMLQIKNKLNSTYVNKLYSAIQSKNKNALMDSIMSIREYFYKTLEIPFTFFKNYFISINEQID